MLFLTGSSKTLPKVQQQHGSVIFAKSKNWQGIQKLLKKELHRELKHSGNAPESRM
jgi:hypothetical protein